MAKSLTLKLDELLNEQINNQHSSNNPDEIHYPIPYVIPIELAPTENIPIAITPRIKNTQIDKEALLLSLSIWYNGQGNNTNMHKTDHTNLLPKKKGLFKIINRLFIK